MSEGITVDLKELIALKRYAKTVKYRPEASATRSGHQLSRLRGRGMDFSEARNYQAGDEIRHMEWRMTARTGRPHVKVYQEERERPVVLLTDFSPSMYFGTRVAFKTVVAAKLSAMLAWTAIKQGDRAGGLFFNHHSHQEFMPRARESGVLPMLSALCERTLQHPNGFENATDHLSKALLRLRRAAKPGSILVMISDFYGMNAECEKQIHRLKQHNDLMAYHICDPIEIVPPQPNQYAVSNGSDTLLLDTQVPEIFNQYHHYWQEKTAHLQSLFTSRHGRYVRLTAEQDVAQVVLQTYPGRSHV